MDIINIGISETIEQIEVLIQESIDLITVEISEINQQIQVGISETVEEISVIIQESIEIINVEISDIGLQGIQGIQGVPGNALGVNTYIQDTDPAPLGVNYAWWQTSGGSLVTLWINII